MTTRPSILLLVITLIIGLALGAFAANRWYAYRSTPTGGQPPKDALSQKSSQNPGVDSIYNDQTATFRGVITKVNKDSVEVKDQGGRTDTFPVDPTIVINKPSPNGTVATPSSDLKQLTPGVEVYLMSRLIDGQYRVISATFPPKRP